MSTKNFLFKLFYKPLTGWATRRALIGRNRSLHKPEKGRFTAAEVGHLLDQSWRAFDELVPDVGLEPTLGSRMNVRLAALTLATLNMLTEIGIERKYAIELIGDVCWNVYQHWGRVGRLIGRLSGRDPIRDHTR